MISVVVIFLSQEQDCEDVVDAPNSLIWDEDETPRTPGVAMIPGPKASRRNEL